MTRAHVSSAREGGVVGGLGESSQRESRTSQRPQTLCSTADEPSYQQTAAAGKPESTKDGTSASARAQARREDLGATNAFRSPLTKPNEVLGVGLSPLWVRRIESNDGVI